MTGREGLPLIGFGVSLLVACALPADEAVTRIRLDQVGYPASAAKTAVVASEKNAGTFTVHRLTDQEVVFEGELGPLVEAVDSGELVRIADVTAVAEPGSYELRIPDIGVSTPFLIAERPYDELLRVALRSYYGQRCGTAVDLATDQSGLSHAACHPVSKYHTSSGREGERASAGGWHDAGDYGRYVVNSGISVGTLLWAWELFPEQLERIDLSIPESENDVPDILDEVRWNLEWMLTMQDDDGGVWHKETSEEFPGMVMPEDDPTTIFVIGTGTEPFKSSCATGSFAASMAIAARVYEPYDRGLAKRASEAAATAWDWLGAHPDVPFRNPSKVATGEYGDDDCRDERLWAAAEIWRTTRDDTIGDWFVEHATPAVDSIVPDEPPSWRDVGAMAAWSYALGGDGDRRLVNVIERRSVLATEVIMERAAAHPYGIPLVEGNYEWGSNGVAANYGLQLLVANELHPDPAYRKAVLEIVHYLLGRNPFGISFVTGVGSRSVMHPHHRPSVADGVEAPWPGLLAGGPNRNLQDPAMKEAFSSPPPPAMMYLDDAASYATNEIAINWNAPLVFVLAGLR